jgi:hypothetical protein
VPIEQLPVATFSTAFCIAADLEGGVMARIQNLHTTHLLPVNVALHVTHFKVT